MIGRSSIFLLSEAATLEHMVMCGYLFAAFSLKHGKDQGLDTEGLGRWPVDRTVTEVAVQEMLHLSLVNNLLTSIGAAPHFLRPNFPVHSKYFSSAVQMVLLPFGEQALRHFMYLERPEGSSLKDAESLSRHLQRSNVRDHMELVPAGQEFSTIGHLYRGVERGLVHLADKYGEKRLFAGSTQTQATKESFGWPELVAVHDLKSAAKAVETIIVEGEGARGDWRDAHFGRFLQIHDELRDVRSGNPAFEPVQPCHTGVHREPQRCRRAGRHDYGPVHPQGRRALQRLLRDGDDDAYEVLPPRRHLPGGAPDALRRGNRADGGGAAATGPAHDDAPGRAQSPGKDGRTRVRVYRRISYVLPHRQAAWVILNERLSELAGFSARLAAPRSAEGTLGPVGESLRAISSQLEARTDAGYAKS